MWLLGKNHSPVWPGGGLKDFECSAIAYMYVPPLPALLQSQPSSMQVASYEYEVAWLRNRGLFAE